MFATLSPAFASAKEILFGSVRYFCAIPDAVLMSEMFTLGAVVDVDVEVALGEVAFLRELRRLLTCVESTAVPNVLRN